MSLPATSSNTDTILSTQFIEFLTEKDIGETIHLLVSHYIIQKKLTSQDYELSNITAHLQKFLQFVIERNTSFIVRSVQNNKIIGCCINLDIKDLFVLFEGMMNFGVFEMLGMFTAKFKNWVYRLGDARKGDFLVNVVTVFQGKLLDGRSIVDYVLRGVAFAKVIGWKAILYPTADPFLMLRLGGEVMGVLTSLKADSEMQCQGEIVAQSEEIYIAQEQKVTLQKIPHQRYTYIVAMHLDKLRFKYVNCEESEIGSDEYSFQQDLAMPEIQTRKKLYILPKL